MTTLGRRERTLIGLGMGTVLVVGLYLFLVEPLVDCARALCTEGEIVDALRTVFGSYTETPRF